MRDKNERSSKDKQSKPIDKESGLTLVETMAVLAIISIIGVIAVVNVMPALSKGKTTAAKASIATLSTAMESYNLFFGSYPSEADGLSALVEPSSDIDRAQFPKGGFLKTREVPRDPWGNEFIYVFPGENAIYEIISYGADGEEGGEGEAADIYSWQN